MSKICFFVNTNNLAHIDLSNPQLGNPGIGGSEYMSFIVAYYLAQKNAVTMYVTKAGTYPVNISYVLVSDIKSAISLMVNNNENIVIIRESEIKNVYKELEKLTQKVVIWGHNYSDYKLLDKCAKLASIVRYVCVSREQYEQLRDENVFSKCCYIYNYIPLTQQAAPNVDKVKKNIVCYLGSVVEPKSFHVLAKYWKKIKNRVPDAELHIIGSGQLYNRTQRMGALGIADAEYEETFKRYLSTNGVLHDDVVFHGMLGYNKNDVISLAKVGVVNPTGYGETFCISALEFSALGVPVVTKNVGGPKNLIRNRKTGILYNHVRQLPQKVVFLLTHDKIRKRYSQEAIEYTRKNFDSSKTLPSWQRLVDQIDAYVQPEVDLVITGTNNFLKRVKECNRMVKSACFLGFLPSIGFYEYYFNKRKFLRLAKRIFQKVQVLFKRV